MVKQGDIIKTDFDPTKGHEQAGYRPALVLSNELFTQVTNMTLVCPITQTIRNHPLHVKLSDNIDTVGFIMCEQTRAVDLRQRQFKIIGHVPKEEIERVSNLVKASIDVSDDYT